MANILSDTVDIEDISISEPGVRRRARRSVKIKTAEDLNQGKIISDTPIGPTDKELTSKPKVKQDKTIAALGAAKSFVEILNNESNFNQISATARNNILILENEQAEVMSIGRQQAGREESKGFVRGEQALLSAAAQGQSVQGNIARSAQLAEETVGVLNAIQIETNAIERAFGLEQQQLSIEHQVNLVRMQKKFDNITAALSGLSNFASAGGFI